MLFQTTDRWSPLILGVVAPLLMAVPNLTSNQRIVRVRGQKSIKEKVPAHFLVLIERRKNSRFLVCLVIEINFLEQARQGLDIKLC